MATEILKPWRVVQDADIINIFALDANSGNIGEVVTVANSGFRSTDNLGMTNLGITNTYSPRFSNSAKVSHATSGTKPLGILLNNVRETNQFGLPMIYDATRQAEALSVASGQTVPIATKGLFLYYMGNLPSNWNIVGSGAAPSMGGKTLVPAHPDADDSIGMWLGAADKDGYALLSLNHAY